MSVVGAGWVKDGRMGGWLGGGWLGRGWDGWDIDGGWVRD